MGDLKRALADYDAAVAMSPDDISAYTGRGLTFEKLDDLTRARVEFQNALSTKSQKRFDKDAAALETARAHLAALASGAPLPVIPNAPTKALSSISIPTTNAVLPHAIQPQPKQGRRVALVIGNSSYKTVPALPNPEKDAEAIAASLRNVGFDAVTLATDLTREKLVDALRLFANAVEEADWAMVYYAGHGMEVGGVNYLIPVDAKIAVDHDVSLRRLLLIRFSQLSKALKRSRSSCLMPAATIRSIPAGLLRRTRLRQLRLQQEPQSHRAQFDAAWVKLR